MSNGCTPVEVRDKWPETDRERWAAGDNCVLPRGRGTQNLQAVRATGQDTDPPKGGHYTVRLYKETRPGASCAWAAKEKAHPAGPAEASAQRKLEEGRRRN